jgi:hypothetical protein
MRDDQPFEIVQADQVPHIRAIALHDENGPRLFIRGMGHADREQDSG